MRERIELPPIWEALTSQIYLGDDTFVKIPGAENMEIISKKGTEIRHYEGEASATGKGKGKKVGTAYQLESGEIVYLPE